MNNIEKDKLLRGCDDVVNGINSKIEQISRIINSNIPNADT
jgi:hypothetical protein